MNYKNLIKKLELPDNIKAPTKLSFDDIYAKPLNRDDLIADIEAVNSSIDVIRDTRGGTWPSEPVGEDFDFLDLAWHEQEFREGNSFAYAVYNDDKDYIGCFYLYGMGIRNELTEEMLGYEVDASWWVSKTAYDNGYYEKLQRALETWLTAHFGFKNIHYSNKKL